MPRCQCARWDGPAADRLLILCGVHRRRVMTDPSMMVASRLPYGCDGFSRRMVAFRLSRPPHYQPCYQPIGGSRPDVNGGGSQSGAGRCLLKSSRRVHTGGRGMCAPVESCWCSESSTARYKARAPHQGGTMSFQSSGIYRVMWARESPPRGVGVDLTWRLRTGAGRPSPHRRGVGVDLTW